MTRSLNHPSMRSVSIDAVLHALSDPIRRRILLRLLGGDGMSCSKACTDLPPSTISFHHRVLREAGLIRSVKRGVEVVNVVRKDEIDVRFPGLVDTILGFHESTKKKE